MNQKQILLIFSVILCVLYPQGISIGGSVDVNSDGAVNTADLAFVDDHLGRLGVHAADVNDDEVVNIIDLILVKNAIGTTTPPAGSIEGMALIPAGEFQMGSDDGATDERPIHTVYVDAFYMDKYEVTNAQYKKFVDANPQWQKGRIDGRFHDGHYLQLWKGNNYPEGKGDHPVGAMGWYAAMAYAQWMGKRLPTEAEWEKAARGGLVGKTYPWGNTSDPTKANYDLAVGESTPVGSYPANAYGLYDMCGNAAEWCLDEYQANFYTNSPQRNPIAGAASVDAILDNYTNVSPFGSRRVLRGGFWGSLVRYVRYAQVACRASNAPLLTFDSPRFPLCEACNALTVSFYKYAVPNGTQNVSYSSGLTQLPPRQRRGGRRGSSANCVSPKQNYSLDNCSQVHTLFSRCF